jgi:hypothetical protein
LAGLAYETLGTASPFWLAALLLAGVVALVAGRQAT